MSNKSDFVKTYLREGWNAVQVKRLETLICIESYPRPEKLRQYFFRNKIHISTAWKFEQIFFQNQNAYDDHTSYIPGAGVTNFLRSFWRAARLQWFSSKYLLWHKNILLCQFTADISRQRCQRRECKSFQLRGIFSYWIFVIFLHIVLFHTQCVILHTLCNFTHTV